MVLTAVAALKGMKLSTRSEPLDSRAMAGLSTFRKIDMKGAQKAATTSGLAMASRFGTISPKMMEKAVTSAMVTANEIVSAQSVRVGKYRSMMYWNVAVNADSP